MEKTKLEVNKKELLRTIKTAIILIILSGLMMYGLSFKLYQDALKHVEKNNQIITVNSEGEATYEGEREEGRKTLIQKNKEVKEHYQESADEYNIGNFEYARNGFVYRNTTYMFGRVFVYDYGWLNVPKGETEETTVKELITDNKVKLIIVGMFLTGSFSQVILLYFLFVFIGQVLQIVNSKIYPYIITRMVLPKDVTEEQYHVVSLSWRLLLNKRMAEGKEYKTLRIIMATVFGVGGWLGDKTMGADLIEVGSWYFILYMLLTAIVSYDIYDMGIKLKKEKEKEGKG